MAGPVGANHHATYRNNLCDITFAGPDSGIAVGQTGMLRRPADGSQTWSGSARGVASDFHAVAALAGGRRLPVAAAAGFSTVPTTA